MYRVDANKEEEKMKSTKLLIALSFSALCSLSTAAIAVNSGLYLGGAAGQSEFDDIGELERACSIAGVPCRDDDTDTGFKLFLGYQFGDYFAVEAGYFDLGALSAGVEGPVLAEADFEITGGFVSLLPQLPLGDMFTLYGRLGVTAGDADLTARVPTAGFDESENATGAGFTFGAGGALNLTRHVTLRLEWERHSFDEAFEIAGEEIDAPDIDLISGSLLLRF